MIKSVYIEFDPILPSQWQKFYKAILDHMKKDNLRIVTWETGIVLNENPNRDKSLLDTIDSIADKSKFDYGERN